MLRGTDVPERWLLALSLSESTATLSALGFGDLITGERIDGLEGFQRGAIKMIRGCRN